VQNYIETTGERRISIGVLYRDFRQTCAVPPRPIGMLATIWAMACFGSGAKIGVSIVPGLMTLARDSVFIDKGNGTLKTIWTLSH